MVVECGGGDNVRQEVGGTGRCKSKGKKRKRENVKTHSVQDEGTASDADRGEVANRPGQQSVS